VVRPLLSFPVSLPVTDMDAVAGAANLFLVETTSVQMSATGVSVHRAALTLLLLAGARAARRLCRFLSSRRGRAARTRFQVVVRVVAVFSGVLASTFVGMSTTAKTANYLAPRVARAVGSSVHCVAAASPRCRFHVELTLNICASSYSVQLCAWTGSHARATSANGGAANSRSRGLLFRSVCWKQSACSGLVTPRIPRVAVTMSRAGETVMPAANCANEFCHADCTLVTLAVAMLETNARLAGF
jgi:hypothetical protein